VITIIQQRNQKINIFEGSIKSVLFKLAWPIILTNILQTIYNITDAFFLGKLGKIEFSVPTITWPIIFIFISLASGFSHAGSSMVSQYTGMKDKTMAEKSAANTIVTIVVLSIVIMFIVLLFSPNIISIMKVSQEVFDLSVQYMNIIVLAMPFMFLMELSAGIYRGWGNSFIALKFTFLSVIINIILDPIFIFYFDFGVLGAALATFLARSIIACYFMFTLIKGTYGFKIDIKYFKPDFRLIKKVLQIGFPASIGQSITSIGFTIIMGVVSSFGTVVVSAYGVGNRINSMVVMFAIGMELATASMCGQFIGADEPEKAEETVKKAAFITFSIILSISFLLFFFGQYVTRFFINDPEVIEMGKVFFKMVSFSLPFFATMSIFMGALRGTGHTVQSTTVDMIRLWVIRIPLVVFMADIYGFKGIFIAMIISNISAMVLAYLFLKFGNWKIRVVEKYEKID
jgi:putative MATE family efflux protein